MDRKNVHYELAQIKDIKGARLFYDIHAHPFEVIDGGIKYDHSLSCNGLYSSVSTTYRVPDISDLSLRKEKTIGSSYDKKILNNVLRLSRRRIYAHSGPVVFGDEMRLACIDRVLLLPVVLRKEEGEQQLHQLSAMFGDDSRFMLGYCVPNDIPINEISKDINWAVNQYKVVTLKIHPGLQGIDPSAPEGKDRIESILSAAKEAGLSVTVHGGLSPYCKDAKAVAYGSVRHLQHIDWSITPGTVTIAHSGFYGHTQQEVVSDALPLLGKLLSRHPNIVVDISDLEFDSLLLVFGNLDLEKICFGSDSLYEKQWVAMVKMWRALKQSVRHPEESLLKVASENPHRHFQGESEYVQKNTDQIESNR